MDNNEDRRPLRVRAATKEELIEWGLALQRDYRESQKIISADGLLFVPHPPRVNQEEVEWIESEDSDSIKWRR